MCIRGGQHCDGYSSIRKPVLLPIPGAIKPPVPLQSEDGHLETSDSSQRRHTNGSPTSARPYRGSQARPVPLHEREKPCRYATTASNEPPSRPPYLAQPWPHQQGQHPDTKNLPPLTEINRKEVPAAARALSRPLTPNTGVPPPTLEAFLQRHLTVLQPPPRYPIQPASPPNPTPQPSYPPQQQRCQHPPAPPLLPQRNACQPQ